MLGLRVLGRNEFTFILLPSNHSNAISTQRLPGIPCTLISSPGTEIKLRRLRETGKSMVLCFVSKPSNHANDKDTETAVRGMETGAEQMHDKATFCIVSLNSLEQANELHMVLDIKNCLHVYLDTEHAVNIFGTVHTPAFYVINQDGRLILQSEVLNSPYLCLL